MDKQTPARETYDAFRRGEISAAEAAKRANDWYAANRGGAAQPPKK